MKSILVRIGDGQAEKLAALKAKYGISVSQLIRFGVAHLIDHHSKIAKDYPIMAPRR